jgi:hypothetical protein
VFCERELWLDLLEFLVNFGQISQLDLDQFQDWDVRNNMQSLNLLEFHFLTWKFEKNFQHMFLIGNFQNFWDKRWTWNWWNFWIAKSTMNFLNFHIFIHKFNKISLFHDFSFLIHFSMDFLEFSSIFYFAEHLTWWTNAWTLANFEDALDKFGFLYTISWLDFPRGFQIFSCQISFLITLMHFPLKLSLNLGWN